jgi:phospholipid/cholesterol/gamma-HCH transport system substrate-binding protein
VLTNVLGNVDRVSNNLNAVFDADNRAALKSTLADVAALAHALAAQQGTLARACRTPRARRSWPPRPLNSWGPRCTASAPAHRRCRHGRRWPTQASAQAGLAADAAASSVQQPAPRPCQSCRD